MCFGTIPDMAKIQEALTKGEPAWRGVILVVHTSPLRRTHGLLTVVLAFMEEMTVDHEADDLAHAEQVINEIERGMLLTV